MTTFIGATAKLSGLARCDGCNKISLLPRLRDDEHAYCPRCTSVLHTRIPHSIAKTWALLLSAAILLVPANLYPVMTVIHLGQGQPDTIVSGIIRLAQAGLYPIAAVVFIASVLVPAIKLIGLVMLLVAIQRKRKINHRQAIVMYRFIHIIGRWSMLDLFIISILITLVNLGALATIHAGAGATAFASVVVITVLAAHSFDQRLIWDLVENKNE
ncbi:MAG: paraquat-inducible protein A [Gammaproteobacteria bacterium]|nr:paraquat-inducible protein A [Gammaproteobacteria bacterium]